MLPKLRPNGEAEQRKLILSRALESEFDVPVPQGKKLFSYQKAGIEFCTLNKNTLIADPPGVGKTIQAIGFINVKNLKKVVIVCPTSVVYNWKRELSEWLYNPLQVEVYHPKTFNENNKPDVLIFSYFWAGYLNSVMHALSCGPFDLLVIDECHFLKNPKAKRTKHVLAKNGLRGKSNFVHALSGTPIVNRPIELYPIVKSLCPEAIGDMNYFEYGIQFCNGFEGTWGWDFRGASNLNVLGMKLRSHFMLRRKKEEVLKELPEKFPPNLVYLDQTKNAKAVIEKLKVFDDTLIVDGVINPDFEDISELRKELGVSKLEYAVKYIQNALESGHEKIVVMAHHKDVIAGLRARLIEYNPLTMTGDHSAQARDFAIKRFQTEKQIRLFIMSVSTAIGITLTAAAYTIFVEFSWVPGENEQAIDRVHRIGQTKGVLIDYLVYENTLDEKILSLLIEKSKVIKEVLA